MKNRWSNKLFWVRIRLLNCVIQRELLFIFLIIWLADIWRHYRRLEMLISQFFSCEIINLSWFYSPTFLACWETGTSTIRTGFTLNSLVWWMIILFMVINLRSIANSFFLSRRSLRNSRPSIIVYGFPWRNIRSLTNLCGDPLIINLYLSNCFNNFNIHFSSTVHLIYPS